jgi:NNP family nitrate/nitrite transporter-like MFS transporter
MGTGTPRDFGSLGRIPLGVLTDRYRGRTIFSVVTISSIAPALMMGFEEDYWQLITCGLFIGVALASFSAGVGFVSGWYPPEKQGMVGAVTRMVGAAGGLGRIFPAARSGARPANDRKFHAGIYAAGALCHHLLRIDLKVRLQA